MIAIHTPVGIVGAGPVGLTLALHLARAGVASTVLDAGHHECTGSRAIALHASALEIWALLGVTPAILREGVAWPRRHTYYRDTLLHTLELPGPGPDQLPLWVNLPQSRLEELLISAVLACDAVDVRWGHRVVNFAQDGTSVALLADTDSGYTGPLYFRYVVAADGARSAMRQLAGLPFPGRTYEDQFLITDIRAAVDWPAEPRMFFDHPANRGLTLLIHPQPEGIWRVDWQLGKKINPDLIEVIGRSRLDQLLGAQGYEVLWSSAYRFEQRLLPQLEHGRIFFAGDAAHLCAPFGARGLNSGIQDVACLAPRLARVVRGDMAPEILRSYTVRRMASLIRDQHAVIDTMRFMAPQTRYGRTRQKTILTLAQRWGFARGWVNSGKMYQP